MKEFLALKQLRPQGYRTIRFIGFQRVLSRGQSQCRVHHVRHSRLPCGHCFQNCSRGFVSRSIVLVWVISRRDEAASNEIIVRAYPFKAYWLRDIPTSLTLNNCTLCPHCIYAFCIYPRTNSNLCHLQHKLIGFYNRNKIVYYAVRTGSLNKTVCALSLKG